MAMVMGICDAAVAATTTVGTEAADIIMDGTGADIADTTNCIHAFMQKAVDDGAALIDHGIL
jgi:hypothetical protein